MRQKAVNSGVEKGCKVTKKNATRRHRRRGLTKERATARTKVTSEEERGTKEGGNKRSRKQSSEGKKGNPKQMPILIPIVNFLSKGLGAANPPLVVIHIVELWHNLWLLSFQLNDKK